MGLKPAGELLARQRERVRKHDREAGIDAKRAYLPVASWENNSRLEAIFKAHKGNIHVGSIVAAGHMPTGFTQSQLERANVERNQAGEITSISTKQLNALRDAKIADGKSPIIRFVDTKDNITAQQQELYTRLKQIYTDARANRAEKVLFSVCSISAGFDLNYSNALMQLMREQETETGERIGDHIIFSVYLPFNIDAVTTYSIPHGLHPDHWKSSWKNLLDAQNEEFKDSIFIHEPHYTPYFLGDKKQYHPNENEMHARGEKMNGDVNSVYSDVNRMMVHQALRAANWDTSKILGLFGETFQASNAEIGGAPEVMAMLYYAGVPFDHIMQIADGLTDPNIFAEDQFKELYTRLFEKRLENWDRSWLVRRAWHNAPPLKAAKKEPVTSIDFIPPHY